MAYQINLPRKDIEAIRTFVFLLEKDWNAMLDTTAKTFQDIQQPKSLALNTDALKGIIEKRGRLVAFRRVLKVYSPTCAKAVSQLISRIDDEVHQLKSLNDLLGKRHQNVMIGQKLYVHNPAMKDIAQAQDHYQKILTDYETTISTAGDYLKHARYLDIDIRNCCEAIDSLLGK